MHAPLAHDPAENHKKKIEFSQDTGLVSRPGPGLQFYVNSNVFQCLVTAIHGCQVAFIIFHI